MFRRSSHSVWDCRYHLVWATKRRLRALKFEGERAYCEKLLQQVAEKYDMFVARYEGASLARRHLADKRRSVNSRLRSVGRLCYLGIVVSVVSSHRGP
jgi:hypothetical protein